MTVTAETLITDDLTLPELLARRQLVPIAQIRVDGGTQMRADLNEETVAEYTGRFADYNGWGDFPPAVLFYDGIDHWMGDGFHRIAAYRRFLAGTDLLAQIRAIVHPGTRRDAILYAVTANNAHGLRRTNADKRKAVEALLRDDEWRQWSDREIARRCGVDHAFVGKLRAELTGDNHQSTGGTPRKGGDGRIIDTANIGTNQPRRTDPQPRAARPVPPPAAARTVYERGPHAGIEVEPALAYYVLLLKLCSDVAEYPAMLDDFAEQRIGWYDNLLGCYVSGEIDRVALAQAATRVQTQLARGESNEALFAGDAPADDGSPLVAAAEPAEAPDTWAAGAVGLNRDWTPEELAAYAAANEVVTTDAPAPTVNELIAATAAEYEALIALAGVYAIADAPASLDDLPLVEAEAFPGPTAAERLDRRNTYAWLRTIYAEARDALREYEDMTGDFSRGPLLRLLEPMVATLDRHLAVYETGKERPESNN